MTQPRRHSIHVGIEQKRLARSLTLKRANQIAHRIYLCRQAQRSKLLLQIAPNVFLVTRSARYPHEFDQRLTKTIHQQLYISYTLSSYLAGSGLCRASTAKSTASQITCEPPQAASSLE